MSQNNINSSNNQVQLIEIFIKWQNKRFMFWKNLGSIFWAFFRFYALLLLVGNLRFLLVIKPRLDIHVLRRISKYLIKARGLNNSTYSLGI